jgi:hypothetical protein
LALGVAVVVADAAGDGLLGAASGKRFDLLGEGKEEL